MSRHGAILSRKAQLKAGDEADMLAVLNVLPWYPLGWTTRKLARELPNPNTRDAILRVKRALRRAWDHWGILIKQERLCKTGNGKQGQWEYWLDESLSRIRAARRLGDDPEERIKLLSEQKEESK